MIRLPVSARPSAPFWLAGVLLLTACQSDQRGAANVPGSAQDSHPYDGIHAGEVLHFVGTEPFWGGEAKGTVLTYTTPEKPEGETITVARFAGRNGISLTGKLDGQAFGMAVTPGECSDGMSDNVYALSARFRFGDMDYAGCGEAAK